MVSLWFPVPPVEQTLMKGLLQAHHAQCSRVGGRCSAHGQSVCQTIYDFKVAHGSTWLAPSGRSKGRVTGQFLDVHWTTLTTGKPTQ